MKESPIEIVCHRGANEYAPENTYASSQICIDWGIDYLEIDINTSKDGTPYLFHGPDLYRTTGADGRINEWFDKDLDQLDCGSWFDPTFKDERLPKLEPFLEWIDHRIKLFFDVKWSNLKQLREIVYRYGIEDECFFWFGREKFARELVQLDDALMLKINVRNPVDVVKARDEYKADIVEFVLTDASSELIKVCRELEVKSMILHTENDAEAFQRIINSGVDMVNLDHANHFLSVFHETDGN